MTLTDLKSMLPEELEAFLQDLGEPKYRAKQIFSWLSRGVRDLSGMRNLPRSLQEKLAAAAYVSAPALLRAQTDETDGTAKYLWGLSDGSAVETVVMRHDYGLTVCLSTQAGCRMGCAFCASTIGGLARNLTPGEMLDEVLFSAREYGGEISHIVLMGVGEPLDNYENVLKFLRLVNCPEGLNIGMRHITLSTCGLTEKIDALAKEKLQITLAISLHAPDDETRTRLMPANRGRGVGEILRCCRDYFAATGRRITFEYAMIDGVNDAPEQAEALADLARKAKAHINLIPLNYVAERANALKPSPAERRKKFCAVLEREGANFTLRRSLGGNIDSACGQLRSGIRKET